MTANSDAQKTPAAVERFVRQLVVTNKAVQLYPPSSEIPRQNATEAVAALDEAFNESPELVFAVTKNGLYFEDIAVLPKQTAFIAFSRELYNRQLATVLFHSGVEVRDVLAFLTILKSTPEEVRAGGGYEALMWDKGITTITVVEAQITLVDQAPGEGFEGEPLEGSSAPEKPRPEPRRSREHIEITRIMADRNALQQYLTDRVDADGRELSLEDLGKRFLGFAEAVSENPGGSGDDLAAVLAQALWGLNPDLRRELLEEQVLPQARSSEALGSVIRRVDFAEMTRMLTEGQQDFDEHRVGLVRALKNLVQVSHADRPALAKAAAEAMSQAGAREATVRDVVAEAVPTQLTVRGNPLAPRSTDSEASLALKLLDHVPLSKAADPRRDREVAALQREAASGVTESDVIAALVGVAALESRETEFANTMSVLEDMLSALVARGELETAAEAAITLLHAAQNTGLGVEQRRRLGRAVTRFTRPEDMRRITQALRVSRPGQSQYEAAEKLLETLGVLAIAPLLELLADEPDRSERKALVNLISKYAPKYVSELSSHVGDNRWFFVRNVVGILGSTRSSAILGALERTLRHGEPRVRRETIRALSMVQDRMADEMLIAALSDDEANNVQLAARYLGAREVHSAVFALEQVAKGEGHGNRENGPRIEAIQALGKIGAAQALPTLKSLARRRVFRGGARVRELRAAASAAMAAIKAKGGGRS